MSEQQGRADQICQVSALSLSWLNTLTTLTHTAAQPFTDSSQSSSTVKPHPTTQTFLHTQSPPSFNPCRHPIHTSPVEVSQLGRPHLRRTRTAAHGWLLTLEISSVRRLLIFLTLESPLPPTRQDWPPRRSPPARIIYPTEALLSK